MKGESGSILGQIIVGAMFFGGLAAGPGYWLHAKFYSGKPMEPIQIRPAGAGIRPVKVALSPDMNPLSLALTATYQWTRPDDTHNGVAVALYDGQAKLAGGSASFEPEKASEQSRKTVIQVNGVNQTTKTTLLGSFTVPRADSYTFTFSGPRPEDRYTVHVRDVRLELRRNMKAANMAVVWTGVVVLLISLPLSFMAAPARLDN